MNRVRAGAIVLKDSQILLMYRQKNGEEYYVFPGGGVEEGETPEQAVVREVKEETCLEVELEKFLYETPGEKSFHKVYLCRYISGTPALAEDSHERARMNEHNVYTPGWYRLEQLKDLIVYPLVIRDCLIADLQADSLV